MHLGKQMCLEWGQSLERESEKERKLSQAFTFLFLSFTLHKSRQTDMSTTVGSFKCRERESEEERKLS